MFSHHGFCVVDAKLASKCQTLWASFFEVAAGRAAVVVDLTGVFAFDCAEMNACARIVRRKSDQPKVSRLYGLGDIGAALRAPTNQVCFRNQDTTIGARSAADATLKAIELGSFVHRLSLAQSRG